MYGSGILSKLIVLSVLILLSFSNRMNCQSRDIFPETVEDILSNSVINNDIRIYQGNLNLDDYNDKIVRFKIKNEQDQKEHIYLFLGDESGDFCLFAKNDSIVEDGVDGTSFDKIVIHDGSFSLEYRGYGNTSGSYFIITFKYSHSENNWLLSEEKSQLFHRYVDGDGSSNPNIHTRNNFKRTLFKDY